ncbi:hypothetical protein ABIB57_004236 [Devosia sp. UYZn731]|uniref:hypothetical protein n=1 Tax=Devosia sp. UYZn731 TaxID=3156345 RepID=UPI0033995689
MRPVAEQHLGLKWDEDLAEVVANAEDMVVSSQPAPVLAAEIAAAVYRARPDDEFLGFWLADMLLMGQVAPSIFKSGENRKRIRPEEKVGAGRCFWLMQPLRWRPAILG